MKGKKKRQIILVRNEPSASEEIYFDEDNIVHLNNAGIAIPLRICRPITDNEGRRNGSILTIKDDDRN